MRTLRINPQKFDIELAAGDIDTDSDLANVYYTFSESNNGEVTVNSAEAEKIGEWFLKLSKEIKGKHVRSSKRSS